jgi:hypothetical protein
MAETRPRSRRDRLATVALAVGYVALALGLLRARAAPASEYEVSIYGGTPPAVWIALALAVLIGTTVAILGTRGLGTSMGVALVLAVVATVAFLPLIRNYHSYGIADSLTHMGWARGILTGEMNPLSIVYPGAHAATATVAAVTGVHVGRGMMFVIGTMVAVFLVFIPMVVRTLVGDRAAVVAGGFSAAFLLPVTNVSTFVDFHTFSLATYFFPVVLFLLFKYLADSRRQSGLANALSSTGLVLVLVGIATDLYHPQVAVNLLVLFGTIVAVQWLYRWLPGGGPLANARSLLAPTLLIAAFFALWTLRYEVVYSMLGGLVESLQLFVQGEAVAGEVVKQRQESATGLGISLFELFWKLYFVHAAYVLLAAGLVLVGLAGRLNEERPDRNAAVTYVAYGGLALTPFFLLHFVGDVSGYFFRHIGFGMVLITLLGALALHALQRRALDADVGSWLRPIAVVAVVAGLTLSMLVMFPSPFIYKGTHHVTDQTMTGHEMAFEHLDGADDVRFVGLDPGPGRFEDALRADVLTFDRIPPAYMGANNMTQYMADFRGETPYYLTVTDHNYALEVRARGGHEYSRQAFANLGTEPGVSRVQTNGHITVYYVGSGEAPAQESAGADASTGEGEESDEQPEATAESTPEPTPTEEPTPEPTPEQEATPEPTPTTEPTPTVTPASTENTTEEDEDLNLSGIFESIGDDEDESTNGSTNDSTSGSTSESVQVGAFADVAR